MKTIIIIPARGGSKGLPGKNIKKFNGKPLIAWTIEQSLSSNADKVVVSTDDKDIKKVSLRCGVEVCDRPKSLALDDSSVYEAIFYTLQYYEARGEVFNNIVLCEPTKPMRETKDINTAIELLNGIEKSIVSIVKAENNNPENCFKLGRRGILVSSDYNLKQRQSISDVYYPEGTIYGSHINTLREKRSFYHDQTYGYLVGRHKAIEIDYLSDFIACEALHKYYYLNK